MDKRIIFCGLFICFAAYVQSAAINHGMNNFNMDNLIPNGMRQDFVKRNKRFEVREVIIGC